ncbi:MAG: hypothetical protein WDZ83_00260 [Rhizobiaceae bacterium]
MTERLLGPDTGGPHAPPENAGSAPPSYFVRLRRDLQTRDVTRLLHYMTDFGRGDARVHASDSGWTMHLTHTDDLRLLNSQCADLIEDRAVGTVERSDAA